jgi:hypothetical protein
MSALDNNPVNGNFLSPLNFSFQLKRAPYINFFVQKINLPSVSLDFPLQQTPFTNIPIAGEHVRYGDLNVTFKVDENLQNWFEIHNWIRSLGFPDNFGEYSKIALNTISSGNGVLSDITVLISDSVKNPNYSVTFRDAFPVSLSDLNFQTTDSSVDYITASASFRYILFDIQKI